MSLTIQRFADTADVGVETIRFYQRKGLLPVPSRRQGQGARQYGPEDVRRLRFIRKAQRAGFTLEEIRELIELDSGQDHARAHAMATTRLGALDRQIAEMQQMQRLLRDLADDCATHRSGACPILAAFER
jgi:MerR family transcriptional regulator, mercuric resistance operon regulatory protein